ncbi:hypothetical protein AAHE18_20G119200 [Arachis hypogaea]
MMSHHTRLIQSGVSSSILLSMGTYPCLLCRTVLVFLFLVVFYGASVSLYISTTKHICKLRIKSLKNQQLELSNPYLRKRRQGECDITKELPHIVRGYYNLG